MLFNQRLLNFVAASPTPFHAIKNAKEQLLATGFEALSEADEWTLLPGNKYFVTRRDSSMVAFVYGLNEVVKTGLRVLGAHTDSPCLKIKPDPDIKRHGFHQVGVEVYGGVLLSPWFDRDLSLAGRVSIVGANGQLEHHLIDFKRPVATIPNLAIHLDRNVNSERSINPQEQMSPILWQGGNGNLKEWLAEHLVAQGITVFEVLDFDLSFYDVQEGSIIGARNEFLASARLDNLLSCFVALQSLIACDGQVTSLVVLNDHEEVGSRSTSGACGNLLTGLIERLFPDNQQRHRIESQSMMLSVDNAHGIHPNFAAKHDSNHAPQLNAGPVLKYDANQSYATQSMISSQIRLIAKHAGVDVQSYVTRADMRCGSTIGPITATATGIETLDIGVPTFAMHSIRELAGAKDPAALFTLLTAFLNHDAPLVNSLSKIQNS